MPLAGQRPEEAGRQSESTSDAAFNKWLQMGLHTMFDDVASEPIPEDLLKLIEQDREK
ncbi:hypothetical protein MVG78_14095 [Roseomonas gilardii subsp. gilardii]|nr:NepR family anti-sigma factor [Roseomonas gilardii]UPG74423.1 hypothetical protein MVG78_14095 [Roseomonas gilardii subsp. gilardii]